MKITKMEIKDFRLFKNKKFILGDKITVLSGTNAVGKSTLLGLLGNTCELKVKEGRPLLQSQFRTEFSEIFKLSREFDPSKSNILTVYFNDGTYRTCRITWQNYRNKTKIKNEIKRPRIIPEFIDPDTQKRHSQKKDWPSLYLGLSRFYPLGESDTSFVQGKKYIDALPVLTEERQKEYKKILSIPDAIEEVNTVEIKETKRKKVVGITTKKYDYWANSAGQDNLGQILLAIDSYKILKENMGETYKGGLLLIDELDATLHPSAQNRLFDYLFRSAKELDLQIVFTTHSLSLLEYISRKIYYNHEEVNDIELYYMSIANGSDELQIVRNPEFYTINSLLLETPVFYFKNKIDVLSEDDEARWMINHILQGKEIHNRINLLPIKMGKDSLISLIKGDPLYIKNRITVFDADAQTYNHTDNHTVKEIEKLKQGYSLLLLPGENSPEKDLADFLQGESEQSKEYFNQECCFRNGITKILFQNNSLTDSQKASRDTYKKWFQENREIFDSTNLFNFYYDFRKNEIDLFYESLLKEYNKIAKRLMLPLVK